MPSANESSSFDDVLKKLLTTVSQGMMLPDADHNFLQAMQKAIVGFSQQRAKMKAQQATGGGQGGAPGGGGPPGGGMPGGAPPGGMGGPPGMGGGMPGGMGAAGGMGPPPGPNRIAPGGGAGPAGLVSPSITQNPDELRRMLAGSVPPG